MGGRAEVRREGSRPAHAASSCSPSLCQGQKSLPTGLILSGQGGVSAAGPLQPAAPLGGNVPSSEAAEPHIGPRELLLVLLESDVEGEMARCAPFSKKVVVCPSEMEAAVEVTADGGPLPAGGPDALRPPVLCPRGR